MNIIGRLYSHLTLIKASSYQGAGNYRKAIELAEKAQKHCPESLVAFVILGDDYLRLRDYKIAKQKLMEGLSNYPQDLQLNRMMVEAMQLSGEPPEKYIPYLRTYVQNYTPSDLAELKSSWSYQIMRLVLSYKVDMNQFYESQSKHDNSWYEWAKSTLERHDKDQIN